eukprot:11182912-Lingulodinium_polyedra.AAC.1
MHVFPVGTALPDLPVRQLFAGSGWSRTEGLDGQHGYASGKQCGDASSQQWRGTKNRRRCRKGGHSARTRAL